MSRTRPGYRRLSDGHAGRRACRRGVAIRAAHKMNRNFARADELRDKVSRYRSGRSGPKLCLAPTTPVMLPSPLSSSCAHSPLTLPASHRYHVRSSRTTSRCTTTIASGTLDGGVREGGRRRARSREMQPVAAGRGRCTPALASSNLSIRRVHARPHTLHPYQRLARRATEQPADDARLKFTLASRRLNPACKRLSIHDRQVPARCFAPHFCIQAFRVERGSSVPSLHDLHTSSDPRSAPTLAARHCRRGLRRLSNCLTHALWPLVPMRRMNAMSAVAGQMLPAMRRCNQASSKDSRLMRVCAWPTFARCVAAPGR